MRRILQSQGAEVIHLGHNRSVDDVVKAVVEEDADAVAVSSYQGGHVEYFRYLVDRLRAEGMGHVLIYGGGGGVIVPAEIEELHAYGVTRIFSPTDGQRLGLAAMVTTITRDADQPKEPPAAVDDVAGSRLALAQTLTAIELGTLPAALSEQIERAATQRAVPVLGI